MQKTTLLILSALLFGIPAMTCAKDINATETPARNLSADDTDWNYGSQTDKSAQNDKRERRPNRDNNSEGNADPKGPSNWGKLSPDYVLCESGKNQSPVDIDTNKTAKGQARGIKFNYGVITPKFIENNGKLIQVAINSQGTEGANINIDGTTFKLDHMNIHIPSEHTFDGQHYPVEIQFAHQNEADGLAYVSMMVVPGRPDRTLRKLLEQLPMNAGEKRPLPPNALRNTEMKKKLAGYYRYSGSSTTPPCTEGAHWFIMKQPLTLSKEQYQQLRAAINKDNNRPVQDLNARLIYEE